MKDYIHGVELNQLFDHDVLFSLMNFTLLGLMAGPDVVRNLLSMLCHQCSYTLMVRWHVETMISLSSTSAILLDTLRQLQSRIPIELELSLYHHGYCIEASTVPRIGRSLYVGSDLNKNNVCGYVKISIFFLPPLGVFLNVDKVDGHLLYRS